MGLLVLLGRQLAGLAPAAVLVAAPLTALLLAGVAAAGLVLAAGPALAVLLPAGLLVGLLVLVADHVLTCLCVEVSSV